MGAGAGHGACRRGIFVRTLFCPNLKTFCPNVKTVVIVSESEVTGRFYVLQPVRN